MQAARAGGSAWRSGLRSPPIRWVLALLCLLASHAYLTREPGMPMPGMVAASESAGMAVVHEAATPQRMSAPGDDSGLSMPMSGGDSRPAHEADLHHAGPNAPPAHDHGAHCPFCFTAAFALGAGEMPLLLPGPERAAQRSRPTPGQARLAAVHADARAPPI